MTKLPTHQKKRKEKPNYDFFSLEWNLESFGTKMWRTLKMGKNFNTKPLLELLGQFINKFSKLAQLG